VSILPFALVIKSFGVSVCSGESGSESSSEGSEGNSQNVSSAPSLLLCMHYVYTRIVAKENLQYPFGNPSKICLLILLSN
jgi:hypothetical protein